MAPGTFRSVFNAHEIASATDLWWRIRSTA
jgi:hypothetical protein